MFLPVTALGGTPAQDKDPTEAELSDADLDALRALFDKLGDGFLRGDAGVVGELLAPGPDKTRIIDTLQHEFSDAKYIEFRAEQLLPDPYTLDGPNAANRYSVDATLRYRLQFLNDPQRKPVENRIFHNFIVQRAKSGEFKIVNSSFFVNMGQRSSGMRTYLNLVLYGIGVLVLMLIWVWGAADAWSLRPRNTFWRWISGGVPVIGSVAFFIAKSRLKRRR